MDQGIQLQLHIGPVPLPAPRELVEALVSVHVDAGSGDTQSGFELSLSRALRESLPPRAP